MGERGRFITFEGIDGSGKTTQLRLLGERLRAEGREVFETAEPGGTTVGQQIRRILLDSANQDLRPTTELLLYFASRAQNVEQSILPALAAGKIVLCDRFTDSTLAYQGYARGLGAETVLTLDRIACQGLVPDLTLLIDLDLDIGIARTRTRNAAGATNETRLDEESAEFHRRVREAYLTIARQHTNRFRIIDGSGAPEDIAAAVWKEVAAHV
jgi:dTMP kinase